LSGSATYTGTNHQAAVIAVVGVHILAQRRLGWFEDAVDIPTAVWGETEGPGDDARIEFGTNWPDSEAQAKRGLDATGGLDRALDRIRAKLDRNAPMPIVLVLDGSSTAELYREFVDDLKRLRSSRRDGLHPIAQRLTADARNDLLLRQLYVVKSDLDHDWHADLKLAIAMLGQILRDPERAESAFDALYKDADSVCGHKFRRTRDGLEEFLRTRGIELRPIDPTEERFMQRLDEVRQLLDNRQVQGGRDLLRRLQDQLASSPVPKAAEARMLCLRAEAALDSEDAEGALAFAQQALMGDPNNVVAQALGSVALTNLGKLNEAEHMAKMAVKLDRHSHVAWQAMAFAEAARGDLLTSPPQSVAESTPYRSMLVRLAHHQGKADDVLRLTAPLLAAGSRSFDIRYFRCVALLNAPDVPDGTEMTERWRETERIATGLISTLESDNRDLAKVHTVRGLARKMLGESDAADADVVQAYESDPADINAIRNQVVRLMEDGQFEDALGVLHGSVADSDALLLALRARVRLVAGDREKAQRDLADANQKLTAVGDQKPVRFAIAQAFLDFHDAASAEEVLAPWPLEEHDWERLYLAGRIALVRAAYDEAEALFRKAAVADTFKRSPLLAELGLHLRQAGLFAASVRAFEEAGGSSLVGPPLEGYVLSLMGAGELDSAKTIIDGLAASGQLPEWALGTAANIASWAGDVENAITYLTDLVDRSSATPHTKIVLAMHLVDADRLLDAHRYLDEVAAAPESTAMDLLQAAQLLRAAGRPEDSVRLAFRALRRAPQLAFAHKVFASLYFTSDAHFEEPTEVGPDTFVRLREDHGRIREHTIFPDGPVDAKHGEMTIEAAREQGLLGVAVGHRVVRDEGQWTQKQWTVEAIQSTIVHAVQDIIANYEDNFPDEPFIHSIHVGDGKNVADTTSVIRALAERKESATDVFRVVREQMLPLGMAAVRLGVSIDELMSASMGDLETAGPLMVEWSGIDDQRTGCDAAAAGGVVILTRSALRTAQGLGLLDALAQQFTLVAPRSLYDEIRGELAEAERAVLKGVSTMLPGPAGPMRLDFKAGHATLVQKRDRLTVLRDWLSSPESVSIRPRPLTSSQLSSSKMEEMRTFIGPDSFDAFALADAMDGVLYADDIGLRRLALTGKPPRSFSTVTLLPSLVDAGEIVSSARDDHLVTLAINNYVHVLPTSEMLAGALRRRPALSNDECEIVFGTLGGPGVAVGEAAQIGSRTIRDSAMRSIQTTSTGAVTKLILRGMARNAPIRLCAALLARRANKDLALLPRELEQVTRVCAEFGQ
jgi:tetratricopeptide (TPR) repeat protein